MTFLSDAYISEICRQIGGCVVAFFVVCLMYGTIDYLSNLIFGRLDDKE